MAPTSEQLSRALHQRIRELLAADPDPVLDAARRGLDRMRAADSHGHASALLDAWAAALADGPAAVDRILEAATPEDRQLLQASPFAGVLSAQERWRIWREVVHAA